MSPCRSSLACATRKDERERAATPLGALELHAPTVSPHHVLHDGEAEARALTLAREAIVHPVELLEDALVLDLGDARAVVAHRDAHVFAVRLGEQLDPRRIAAVLVRVRQQGAERVGGGPR